MVAEAVHNRTNEDASQMRMIPVTLHDVFHNPERGEAWLVLAEESGQHGLPIFVGSNLRICPKVS